MRGCLVVAALATSGCGDNIEMGEVWGGNLAVADGRMYFSTMVGESEHAIWSQDLDGDSPKQLWRGAPHQIFGDGMAVRDGRVYWSSDDTTTGVNLPPSAVFSAPIEGGAPRREGVFTMPSAAYGGLDVDADHIYAATLGEVIEFDAEPRVLLRDEIRYFRIAGPLMYVLTATELKRIVIETLEVSTVTTISTGNAALCIDDASAYVISGSTLYQISLADGTQAMIATDLSTPTGCAVDARGVYLAVLAPDPPITYPQTNFLVRIDFDGTRHDLGTTEATFVGQFVLDGDYLYYAGLSTVGRVPIE